VGRTGIKDALTRLDRLTQEDDKVQGVDDKGQQVADGMGDKRRSSSNNLI